MMDPLYSLALMTGLFGSAHCIGMCGGIVTALSLTADGRTSGPLFHLLYNVGRTITYGFIGLVVGWLGSALAMSGSYQQVTLGLLIFSDILVILIGLGSAGLFNRINIMALEFAGPIQYLSRAVKGLRRLPPALSALPLGILFGFLPCGLLYAMAITAAGSADPLRGAVTMVAFGVGTIPSLFLVGSAAQWFSRKRNWMLKGAGLMVALMGCYNLFRHLTMDVVCH
ncbi:MAG TPA: sulfite exporter TauE/SafE family protein [Pelovirga sp.]|nr:sulfite exporter TauE/SafE family protein [Pelovirga sp.]